MALAEGVGSKWSIGIDGKGYMISTLDQESPFEYRSFAEQAVPLRTPRIDTSPEPGEASLGDLWVRSQHDWSGGMGQDILDGENSNRLMAQELAGYDPFIEGGLAKASPAILDQITGVTGFGPMVSLGDLMYVITGTKIHRWDETIVEENVTVTTRYDTEGFHHNFLGHGDYLYWATASGIYRVLTTDSYGVWSEAESLVNNLTNCTVLEFGKGRLIACRANDIHIIDDLTSATSGATAHYTHIDTSWIWSDADELGQGFYIAGNSESESKLYLMSFDTTDASAGLTIGIPREVWRAPADERILCVESYAGSALLIGTTRGVRNVIVIDQDGNVVVGPVIEVHDRAKVASIATWGRYAFFGYGFLNEFTNQNAFMAKLDLSTFSFAAPYKITYYQGNTDYHAYIPPWYSEGKAPVMSLNDTGTATWNGRIPEENKKLSNVTTGISTGVIRFGSDVEKEVRSLEVGIDPASVSVLGFTSDMPIAATPDAIAELGDVIFQISANSWAAGVGGTTWFMQGNNDTDYRWRIRIDSNRYLIVQWVDTTDTIRTATSTVAVPNWDGSDHIFIRIIGLDGTNSSVSFKYYEGFPDNEYPDSADWTTIDDVTIGPYPIKTAGGYDTYPIKLIYDYDVSGRPFLYAFDAWANLYTTNTYEPVIKFRPTNHYPDIAGVYWTLADTWKNSPRLKVLYNPDEQGWKRLTDQIYSPVEPNITLTFPDNMVIRSIQLRLTSSVVNNEGPVHGIKSWRLTSEPVPTPRYFRYYVPIMLYDSMTTLDGHRISRQGLADEYLGYLETLYRNGTAFDFQKPQGYLDPTALTRVRIEEMEFKSYAPPEGASGFGGIALVVLKEVAT